MRFVRTLAVLAAVVAPLAAACGGGDGKPYQPNEDPKPTPPPAADDAGTTKLDAAAPPWCKDAEGVYEAKRQTGNVLLLVDRSGSMQIKLSNNTDTRWTATKRGLTDLLASLPSTTRAGAMMFPQGDKPITCCGISPTLNDVKCSCANGELPGVMPRCDTKTYKAPIPVADLTSQQGADILAYVSSSDKEFYWGTPLAPALASAVDMQKAAKLTGTKSVILLTDGYPTSCDTAQNPTANDIQHVVDAAMGGVLGQGDLVRTFVMGVIDGTKGAKPEHLSKIAQAGGTARYQGCENTNDCFYALNAQTFSQDIKKAFQEIALQAFDCAFDMPPPEQGTTSDLSKVNVLLVDQNGQTALSRDTNHQNGWDYLPNNKQVQLYGAACSAVTANEKAHVQIVVGCKTQGQ